MSEDKPTVDDVDQSASGHFSDGAKSTPLESNGIADSASGDRASQVHPAAAAKPPSFDELARGSDPSLVAELFDFLVHNKKWWLAPILIMLALFGILIALSTTSVAPFLYTLF